MMLGTILTIIKIILIAYGFILSISIFLSWIPNANEIKVFRIINTIADIYMRPFRGILVIGIIDFTPLIGISFYSFILGLNIWS